MAISELSTAVLNTFLVCGLSLAIALPIGFFFAFLCFRTDFFWRRLGLFAICSQLAVPLYVFAGGWNAGFGIQGWLTPSNLLGSSGVAWMQNSTASLLAVSIIHAFAAIPWVTLVLSFGLLRTSRSLDETARLEGGAGHYILTTLLPQLKLWFLAAAGLVALPVLTEMVVTNLYQVSTVTELIYLDASQGEIDRWSYIPGAIVCFIPLTLMIVVRGVRGQPVNQLTVQADSTAVAPYPLGRAKWFISIFGWVLIALLILLPIINLIAKAGWLPLVTADGKTSYGWSSERFTTTAFESVMLFRAEFYWSLILGIASAATALTLSSICYALSQRIGRLPVHCLAALVIALPGPLVGMIVIALLNRDTPEIVGTLYDTTLLAPILAQQSRLFPVAWVLCCVLIQSISPRTWEQASLDGLTGWKAVVYVLLPQTLGRLCAIYFLLFVLSVGELSTTILVLPPGVTTVSMRLFEMLHFGMRHQDSGLCGVLILLGWLVTIVFWKTLNDRNVDRSR